MKRFLSVLALAGASLLVAPGAALAQTDTTSTKPQLNTAPPGSKPQLNTAPPGRTAPPTYEKTAPRPAVPVPVPPPIDEPLPSQQPRPSKDNPSGLSFPKGTSSAEQPKPIYKYFVYSNFGLGYSSLYGLNQFSASIAPAIGYRVTEKFAFGPGISYAYNSYAYQGGGKGIHTNSLGVKLFGQYMVFNQFFIHAEYEVTHAEVLFEDNQGYLYPGKMTVKTPLAGVGYRQQFSDKFAGDIVILYNFNDGYQDIYGQPVIRFSFLYNLGK
ncbi:hypothetical protein [Hymenobacter sp. GOD-10R]|uniref:hypothetical protein n=1 Tax=Hymenobacter sp. GOD-10R TaxID=3093922 RepID=UPI002D778B51|nr:hypothetical protein [Hymenobacter sp. GOD-10R]WRQ26337.1 hypothetical protein SD425_14740 [Hymenobacter sp. GOD-10R]